MADRRAYFRWYNVHVRGRPDRDANSYLRIKCLLCGNLAYPSALGRSYGTYAKIQRGYNQYFELDSPNVAQARAMFLENMNDKYGKMARKCAELLQRFIAMGLITEDEIKMLLGLSNTTFIEKAGFIGGSRVVDTAIPVGNIPSVVKLNNLEDVGYG